MIRLQDVTMSRGGVDLLHGAETLISPGERLALIGPNGSGKTSLLRLLCGDILPDQGSVEMPGMRISMLEQLAPESDLPGWQYVLAADEPLSTAQRALALAQSRDDGMAIAHAMDAWQVAGGMDAEARARILLNGLGFSRNRRTSRSTPCPVAGGCGSTWPAHFSGRPNC
ncbi:MAG: ATP-binding cassette domain-containing protein [Burkholderiaceae bacterium]